MKILIFDASTLISFAMNGMLEDLASLKKIFKGKFIITQEVKKEAIDKPLTIKRFELEALKIKNLLDNKILELPDSLNISDQEISNLTKQILTKANNLLMNKGKSIKILDLGETSCLALSKILKQKNIPNIIAVDERTTRIYGEKPENLEKLLENKLHMNLDLNEKIVLTVEKYQFIRSAELIYIAYKKGLIKLKGPKVLEALLYALKYKGCSISDQEIEEIINLNEK